MEPPPLRFAKHPEGGGSSTDPGQPGLEFGAILVLAGRAAHLEAVRRRRLSPAPAGRHPVSPEVAHMKKASTPSKSDDSKRITAYITAHDDWHDPIWMV